MKLSSLLKRAFAFGMAFTVCATSVPVDGLQNVWADETTGTLSEEFVNANVLNLAFEDNLTDSSSKGVSVSVGKGTASYVEGVKAGSKAMSFDGGTYLDMGTDGDLSPENLTLSFWIKPNATMTNEQLITWNKTVWFSDGWYLASENDSTPLSLSIGPAANDGQPYMISVAGSRSEFFPVDEWTHIVVTYDNDEKEAKIYRNGIAQQTYAKYPMSDTSTGVIGPCETTKKTIGFNGPNYNGSFLNAALDEYRIYNTDASLADVIALYEESGRVLDKQAVAQKDADAISLPESTAGNLTLPTEGTAGSVITWTSSNEAVISSTGTVTRPAAGQESVDVTLTATVSFVGGTSVEKKFIVTVQAEGATKDTISDIDLSDVVIEDAYLVNATNKEHEYLLSLNAKQFLYQFYKTAGLTPPTATGYEGWERESGNTFRGHMFGHYMSGISMSYAYADDPETKAALLVQIKDAVEGLKECQDAYATAHPKSAGFIAPFGEGRLDAIDGSNFSGQSHSTASNVFVPWYNLHKVLAGLTDIYTFVDDEELANTALGIAEKFSEYIYNRCSQLSDNTKMLNTEYGGMNEALYEVYDITGNEKVKKAAQYFDEVTLFNSLANNQDVLSGKHANTTIPKLTGALKRYTVMMDNEAYYNALTQTEKDALEKYKTAAINFWDIVIEHHTYITGGNSQSEHFHDADKMYHDAEGGVDDYGGSTTCETCNTYNMLKLSRELYKLTKDKKYMDYYENTYLNAIVSSQNPETGTTMYFQPMAPGYNKVFNRPYDEFWCCTGTGVENFSKLGDTFYFTERNDVYVNMYFANTYEYARQNLKLTMDANMPNEDTVTVKVEAIDGASVKEGTNLKFRIPDWTAGEATILVNGEKQTITDEKGYAVISDVKAGDIITLTFPMEVVAYDTQDNENFIAFKYGPVVLSAGLGTSDIEASNPNGILVRVGTRDTSCQNVIIVNNDTVEEWKANISENLVRIEDSADGKVQFVLKNTDSSDLVYTPHFMRYKERYGLYMTFEVKDSENAQARIKSKKESLRDEELSVDSLYSFDGNNSEAAKNMQCSETSEPGSWSGRTFRHDEGENGWFSYDMTVDNKAGKNYLLSTFTTADAGRSCDLYINGEFQKKLDITSDAGANVFYDDVYEIPEKYWKDNEIVTVKYQSNGGIVGGLYGIAIRTRLDYDTNPALSALSFDKGTMSQKFDANTTAYNLIVPTNTETLIMKASPNTASGLVYVNDILVDDTLDRKVALTGDKTTIQLTSFAQDHKSSVSYTITVIKADGAVDTTNQDAANVVIAKINSIGTVVFTDECKAKIDFARAAYDALTKEQKALVTNYAILTDAEYRYEKTEPRKLAYFTFDDEESGFSSEYAIAKNNGTPVLADDSVYGSALKLNGSSNWLSVTDTNGEALLTDCEELTISYWSKINNTNANWAFYASPDTNAQTYQHEKYLGSLENANITVERYNNTGARPGSAYTANTSNAWKLVTVVFTKDNTIIYVNGQKKSELSSGYALNELLGDNSIFYIGKANWGSGEYYNGLIDEFSIYNYALTDAQAEALYAYYNDEDSKNAVDEVVGLITAIGTVSVDSSNKITAARNAYDGLTEIQKKAVDNYSVLVKAETRYANLLIANSVIAKINAIGVVTANSKAAIDAARAAYNALTDAQKVLVTNIKTLTDAETAYEKLSTSSSVTEITKDSFLKDNQGIPTGKSEESKNSTFGVLKAQVKKATKSSNKIQWSKVADADGYVVLGNIRNSGKKKYAFEVLEIIDNNTTTSYTHASLAKDTYYKYIVQAYKIVDGKVQIIETSKTIYSVTKAKKYANVKSLKTKSKVSLRVKKKATLKVTQKKSGKKLVNCRKVSFESSNTKIATVNKKGVITAKGKGKCTIYVYAQNGIYKKVTVTVK